MKVSTQMQFCVWHKLELVFVKDYCFYTYHKDTHKIYCTIYQYGLQNYHFLQVQ